MAMVRKSAFQKLYEKKRMLELRSEDLTIWVADRILDDGDAEPGVYIGIGKHPIAKLLTSAEINETSPDFDRTDTVRECWDRMQAEDNRDAASDFDLLVGGGFEEEFLRSVDDIYPRG